MSSSPSSTSKNTPDTGSAALFLRLWRDWVRTHWRLLAGAVAFMLLVAATAGALPQVIRLVTEAFVNAPERSYLLVPVAIGVQLVRGVSMYLQKLLMHLLSQRVIKDLQKALFAHLTFADFARLGREPTGTLVSRFTSDVQQVQTGMSKAATSLFRDVFTVIGLFGVMLYIDWFLTLLILICYPLVVIPIDRVGKKLRTISRRTQEQIGHITSFLHESLSAARMIKVYRMEDREYERASSAFERQYRLMIKAVRYKMIVPSLLEVIAGLAAGAIIGLTGWRISQGDATTGDFAGVMTALLMTSQPIRSLGQLHMALQQAGAALQRVFEVLDEPPTVIEKADAEALHVDQPSVRLEQVTFGYAAEHNPALESVCLEARANEFVALVGPSGAGKSTVFNLIPRLYDPTAGSVRIDERDIRDFTLASLRDHMALVSQEATMFNDTILENIRFGRMSASEEEVVEAAKAADADTFIRSFPQGYDTTVGDRGARLSGGQRQRVAIARAILKDAPILLLDEATSALDSEAEKRVQTALDRLRRGRTTFAIAHRLSTIMAADRIYVLDAGKVVESGTHNELLTANGTYARLCKLQFGEE